jgi:hypothetical protein
VPWLDYSGNMMSGKSHTQHIKEKEGKEENDASGNTNSHSQY